MSAYRPALVVLAAGASRRLGEVKALVDLGGRTPLERLTRAAAGSTDGVPLVVTGADHAAIARAAPAGVELLRNDAWRDGRSGGLRLAHRARPARDLVVAPVDVPLVPASVFAALAAAWAEAQAPPRGWLAPVCGTTHGPRHGHPIVVGRELLDELDGLDADTPLRHLRAAASPCWDVVVEAEAVLDDLDTPRDLKELLGRLARNT